MEGSDPTDSESFLENMGKFFTAATFINHINFSGMNFKKQQVFKLLDLLKNCSFLMAIHLNDNGITLDKNYFYDALDEF